MRTSAPRCVGSWRAGSASACGGSTSEPASCRGWRRVALVRHSRPGRRLPSNETRGRALLLHLAEEVPGGDLGLADLVEVEGDGDAVLGDEAADGVVGQGAL